MQKRNKSTKAGLFFVRSIIYLFFLVVFKFLSVYTDFTLSEIMLIFMGWLIMLERFSTLGIIDFLQEKLK